MSPICASSPGGASGAYFARKGLALAVAPLLALACLIVGIVDLNEAQDQVRVATGIAQVGMGLWLTVAASAVALVAVIGSLGRTQTIQVTPALKASPPAPPPRPEVPTAYISLGQLLALLLGVGAIAGAMIAIVVLIAG